MATKVTGYALKEQIKRATMVRDTTASLFDDSLSKFPDETKDEPQMVVDRFKAADLALAKIQVVQQRYNLAVEVEVLGEKMSLCEAIKRVGGAGRVEKMWRSCAGVKKERYGYRGDEDTRDPNMIRSEATINQSQALELAQEGAKIAGAIRAAIATGNAKEVDFQDVTLPDF